MNQEYWKPVVGYEGFYEVSDQGRVRSLDRIDCNGKSLKGRTLKPGLSGPRRNYWTINLSVNGQCKSSKIHVLVAAAFIGPRPKSMHVLHGPKGSLCNQVSNLRYGTRSENEADKLRDGTHQNGEQNHRAKLSRELISQMQQCREREGLSYMQLGKRFGVGHGTAHRALTGRSWKHV